MAIFHCSVKAISRSTGRSATAAAAYHSGELIRDERTGERFDYRRRQGVEFAEIITPAASPEWAHDRAALWNAVEAAERRKDAVIAREIIIALPHELDAQGRAQPDRDGDERNHHAHLLLSTRRLEADGFGAKTRELDDKRQSRAHIAEWRQEWGACCNRALERAGLEQRVDHRSHKDRGQDLEPMLHLGPAATQMQREGERCRLADENAARAARNAERGARQITPEQRQQREESERRADQQRAALQAAWRETTDGAAFRQRAEAEGWTLCRGDRRPYLAIDEAGKEHSLARLIDGAKTADLRARLDGLALPARGEVLEQMRHARADLVREIEQTERQQPAPARRLTEAEKAWQRHYEREREREREREATPPAREPERQQPAPARELDSRS